MGSNIIYYGPPGTGKTYTMQKLKNRYTSFHITDEKIVEAYMDTSHDWLLVALILLQQNGPMTNSAIQLKLDNLQFPTAHPLTHTASTILGTYSVTPNPPFNSQDPKIFQVSGNDWYVKIEKLIAALPTVLDDYFSENDIEERFKFVTFHQSFVYEDFIEGIRPVIEDASRTHTTAPLSSPVPVQATANAGTEDTDGDGEEDEDENSTATVASLNTQYSSAANAGSGDIKYTVQPGVFMEICTMAKNDPHNRYAIFIDEINRGNISAIFGEIITLIEPDKRLGETNSLEVTLPYSKKKFGVPKNLDIYGTMNSTDRSIALIDIALRRRFKFIHQSYDETQLIKIISDRGLNPNDIDGIDLVKFLRTINQRIEVLLDANFLLGHAFFAKVSSFDDIKEVIENQVIPLLEEYFYDDPQKIQLVFSDLDENGDIKTNSIYSHNELDTDILFEYPGEYELDNKKSYHTNRQAIKDAFTKVYF